MKHRLIGLLIIAAFWSVACAEKPAGPEVEVIDGVEYVHNPADPLQPGLKVEFEEELSFGGDEEPKEAALYRPADILVDENDLIYISDYQDSMIKVFDPQGKFVRAIGRQGQGPGEFQRITAMDFLPDGRLLVFDSQSRRTSLFERTGRFIQGHPWRNSHYEILLTDESGYLADENVYGEERWLFIKKYDIEGNELGNWGEFTPMGWKTQTKGEMTISITTPYTPQSIFAADPVRLSGGRR
ncbi:MAG: 6-bladed beta-propeller [Candidatus Aminicenantales bacterium]